MCKLLCGPKSIDYLFKPIRDCPDVYVHSIFAELCGPKLIDYLFKPIRDCADVHYIQHMRPINCCQTLQPYSTILVLVKHTYVYQLSADKTDPKYL